MYIFQDALITLYFGDALHGIGAEYYHTLFSAPDIDAINRLQDIAQSLFAREVIFFAQQVHGASVLNVTPSLHNYYGIIPQSADCLITNISNVPLGIFTADCVPVVLYDPVIRAVALVHAGWRGFVAGVVVQALRQLQKEFCANPKDISVFIGPCAQICCYEVSQEFVDIVYAAYPEFLNKNEIFEYRSGRIFCGLRLAIVQQLLFSGISQEGITQVLDCTLCNTNYYSYRRQKISSGRQITAVMLK